jgi:hypothetical protein
VLVERKQFAVVTRNAFYRITTIHSAAALGETARLFLGCVRGEDDFSRVDAQCCQQTNPELVGGPDVKDFGYPDPQLRPVFWDGGRRPGAPFLQHLDKHV